MLNIDLTRLENEQLALKREEQKLRVLADEFDQTMREVEGLAGIEGFREAREETDRQLDAQLDGIRQLANAAVRIRQLYQGTERRVTDRCDEGGQQGRLFPVSRLSRFPGAWPGEPEPGLEGCIRQWAGELEDIF